VSQHVNRNSLPQFHYLQNYIHYVAGEDSRDIINRVIS